MTTASPKINTNNVETFDESLVLRIRNQKGGEKLDLSLCSLTKMPSRLIQKEFGCPRNLDMSFNHLRGLSPRFVTEFLQVTVLDLSSNELRKLPDNFGLLKNLVYLDVHKNQLKTLPLSMSRMTRLHFLSLANNPLHPPLNNLLDGDLSGMAQAKLVVKILRNPNLNAPLSRNVSFSEEPKETDIIEEVEDIEIDEDCVYLKKTDFKSEAKVTKEEPTSVKTVVVRVCLVALLWVIMIPIFVASVCDTSYLEGFKSQYPAFGGFWTYYSSIHDMAVKIVQKFGVPDCAWALHGKQEPEEAPGFFQRILNW